MIGNEKREKCSSCGGDYYHYAGCGAGEHGEIIPMTSPEPLPSVPTQLLSIRDADTGESEMHIRRVPDGFSLQIQQRGADDYLSVILIPDTARQLRDYLQGNLPAASPLKENE